MDKVVNIVLAGLGGQGVIKASDILAQAAFAAGWDVKKAEIHGMSQRGGSVSSDVRFGTKVLSPMVSAGEADFLVVLDATQVANNRHMLKPGGRLIEPDSFGEGDLANRKSINVALLGLLSRALENEIPETTWLAALAANLPEKLQESNRQAFAAGRAK